MPWMFQSIQVIFVNSLASVPILSQVLKIIMEVQVSNPHGLWLYLSDASLIIKQWEEVEEEKIRNWKCEIRSKAKKNK